MGERFEVFGQCDIAQRRMLESGGELKEIREQPVKDPELIFEGRLAVFGEGRGAGEKLSESLATSGAFEDA